MHSHAVAQKLSAWIFAVLGGEGAGFWPGRARIALRASAEVRARDVMVNELLEKSAMKSQCCIFICIK